MIYLFLSHHYSVHTVGDNSTALLSLALESGAKGGKSCHKPGNVHSTSYPLFHHVPTYYEAY